MNRIIRRPYGRRCGLRTEVSPRGSLYVYRTGGDVIELALSLRTSEEAKKLAEACLEYAAGAEKRENPWLVIRHGEVVSRHPSKHRAMVRAGITHQWQRRRLDTDCYLYTLYDEKGYRLHGVTIATEAAAQKRVLEGSDW